MSHVATIDCEIKDLKILEKAAKRLGMELREQSTYRWWGRSVGDYPIPNGFTAQDLGKCDLALTIPGNNTAYEIGVCKNKNGAPGYTLLWDFYAGGRGLQEVVGTGAGLLTQAYQVEMAKYTAALQGYGVEEVIEADGTINVYATSGY